MNINGQFFRIIESLKNLSLPYADQVNLFPKFVDIPFEIVDEFTNACLLLPPLIEEGKLKNIEIANLLRLNNLINLTLANPDFKDLEEEQFSTSLEWNKIRTLAKETLLLFESAKPYTS